MKGNGISIILALNFGVLTTCSKWFVFSCLPHSLGLFLSFLPLFFPLHPSRCKLKKKKEKNQCHKSVCLNSAHMTFPSSLIASIQFISVSHATPQSIKHALLQRSSCPIITPIIKVQELWVRPSRMTGETNRFLNSPKASFGQEANQSRPLYRRAWEQKRWLEQRSGHLRTSSQEEMKSDTIFFFFFEVRYFIFGLPWRATWLYFLCFQVSPSQKVLVMDSKVHSLNE